ncbi:hypothetical protein HMPREF1275_00299 [Propionibacterium sp. KPL1844]|nr:hypothetical protein HMPREF1275_00299 [Propionibacterium sp. KPL1844]
MRSPIADRTSSVPALSIAQLTKKYVVQAGMKSRHYAGFP